MMLASHLASGRRGQDRRQDTKWNDYYESLMRINAVSLE